MSEGELLRDGRYSLLRKLGEGGQGETWEAVDLGDRTHRRVVNLAEDWQKYVAEAKTGKKAPPVPPGSRVAIKRFRVGKAKEWKDVELAEREAKTLAALSHPRLPRYIEHFEEDGALYLVMEKIEGESLAAIAHRKRTWSPDEVVKLLEDTADALRYLHQRSPFIVHRDIKPGNILRRPDGSYAIVDFGSVRDRLKPGGGSTVVGTFGYMAPEQFQGRASPKSDVYGLGATALTMLTGREPEELPHEGLGIDVARAVPRGTPPDLVRALSAMLTPDPDRRVDSVDDALAFLKRGRTSGPVPAPANAAKSSRPPPRNRKEERALRRAERREKRDREREEKKQLRALARPRAAPLIPRLVARLGLLIAYLVVGLVVGMIVPVVLAVLSLIFGQRLRAAAGACVRAARQAQAGIGRASRWVSGEREGDLARVRVADPRVRVDPAADRLPLEEAEAHGETADAWLDDRLREDDEATRKAQRDRQRAQMRAHAREPSTRRRFWGR